MMKAILLLACFSFYNVVGFSQTFTANAGAGSWSIFTTWNQFPSVPNGGNNVVIPSGRTVGVTFGAAACNDANVVGNLNINLNNELVVNDDLVLQTGGVITINSGRIEVDDAFGYNGTLNINANANNYILIDGNIFNNGNLRMSAQGGGSIQIFSGLQF